MKLIPYLVLAAALAIPVSAEPATAASLNNVWVLVAAFLVFFMQVGFAMLESGMTQAKNACNIIMKNLVDLSAGALAFWAVGFAIMFGAGNAVFGTEGFFLSGLGTGEYSFWLFQAMFAATAATIVSGAIAERMKFTGYLTYTVFLTALIYPLVGHWVWGGGWLSTLKVPFIDFAGSTVVHGVGGWSALAAVIVLGPRLGRYVGKRSKAIPGHSMPLAALGVFILWFGWFGFNAGSTLSATDPSIVTIALTTMLAGSAGTVAALGASWYRKRKPELNLTLGGPIAGLVAITAGCANVSPLSAIIIGGLGGILYVLSFEWLDSMKIDDPVGAIAAHGVCGAWGTLAVGIFAQPEFGGTAGLLYGGELSQLLSQLLGVAAVFAFVFPAMLGFFKAVDNAIGLRVRDTHERAGLDITEHSSMAYS